MAKGIKTKTVQISTLRNAKYELAFEMYINTSMPQIAIASACGVSMHTVSRWKIDNQWETHKQTTLVSGPMLRKRIYQAALDIVEGNQNASLNSKTVDMLIKLATAADKLDKTKLSITARINAYKELVSWLFAHNKELAQQLTPLVDKYIQEVISEQ